MLRCVLSLVLGLGLWSPASAQRDDPTRLAAAQTMLEERPWVEQAAWQTLTQSGLPLVSNHPNDPALARVTFAFRGADNVRAVRLDSILNAPHAEDYVRDYRRDFTLPLERIGDSQLWHVTIDVARAVQATYSFLVETDTGTTRWGDRHNPRQLRGASAEAIFVGDAVTGPAWWTPVPPRLQRQAETQTVPSAYLGRDVALDMHRADDPAAPILILYDSFLWGVRAPAWEIVHNLSAAGRIPSMHVILIDQLDPQSAAANYTDQSAFIAFELLPFLRREIGLVSTAEDIVLAGASRRGLSAAITALEHPSEIGNVLSLSGSFYWAPTGEAPEWLARDLAPTPPASARFLLAAGTMEYVANSTNQGHVMLATNANMSAALQSAGYRAETMIFEGGHDIAAWRAALAEGLITLLGETQSR
jgi:enterochelin esterase-like enzyme